MERERWRSAVGSGRLCTALLAAFATWLAAGGSARAGAPDAVALARAGRCAEAVPLFEAGPETPERALLHSECLVRLRRYAEAAPLLEALVDRDPALAEAWLHLGMARFHLGDPEGAEAALLRAEPALAARPELRLYRGLAWLARGDAAGAAALLDGVSEGSAGPIASYWAGIAWLRAGEAARARDSCAASSPWRRSRRGRCRPRRRSAARRSPGGAGGSAPPPATSTTTTSCSAPATCPSRGRSPASATRARCGASKAGSEWWRREAWSSGVWLDYSGTAHDDLSSLDVHLPGIGLWLDRRLDAATTTRLAYDFSWAFVDGDSFLQSHGLTASAFRSFGSAGTTQLFSRIYDYDYKVDDVDVPDGSGADFSLCPSPTAFVCGAAGVEEDRSRDRDGYGTASGFLHAIRLDRLRTELWLGYTYFRYWADGEEQSYAAHEGRVGARTQLPLGGRGACRRLLRLSSLSPRLERSPSRFSCS